ncbi:hypothetical protein, partial [uncultured Campylobacter sp.]|uniref:hypothetical protein n=1 Tax=uncultured Campylobacter sp. TaxID=218934 RepID=UPI002617E3C2
APSTLWLFIRMIFVLALVIVCIYVLVYFLKKGFTQRSPENPFLKRACKRARNFARKWLEFEILYQFFKRNRVEIMILKSSNFMLGAIRNFKRTLKFYGGRET